MKLSIINDELDQNLDKAINVVRQELFQGIEIRSVWNTPPDKLNKEDLRKIKYKIEEAGLFITGFDSPCLKIAFPRKYKDVELARKSLVYAISQARILNAGFVRIFTFFREGEANPKQAGKIIKELFEGLILDNLEIFVETGMRTNTPSMYHMLKFLDVVGDNCLGVVWDPGNTMFSGVNAASYSDEYMIGRDVIKHIHIKDPKGQVEYVRLGEGDVPWLDILKMLKNEKFAGWLSLETHWRKDRILDQIQRDNPWGDSFSKGGLEASIECMRQLQTYMRCI
ncbi:sugar phosphate isomerase/epimerase family protein [Bacillus cereus]|uniref:sugar phosphate isomerase/epimerase family protein n=1 Tax=Bacillus cereus TaxID=1396 RepID=UPI003557C97D|nr:sugar phosphate isomerase/epimerase [Bacillus cereus]